MNLVPVAWDRNSRTYWLCESETNPYHTLELSVPCDLLEWSMPAGDAGYRQWEQSVEQNAQDGRMWKGEGSRLLVLDLTELAVTGLGLRPEVTLL